MTTEPPTCPTNPTPEDVAESSKLIHLPFENLRCFEVVREQFAHLGILFENTVVLQPSNAAYFPEVGRLVLMGAPQNGWLEIRFTIPITHFRCRLTSSQPAVISAYDSEDHLLQTLETVRLGDRHPLDATNDRPPEPNNQDPDFNSDQLDNDQEGDHNTDGASTAPPPNLPIHIQASHIARISLSAIDGQLVIYEIQFGV